MFDDAPVLECYRRAQSIVPQQALALQNSRQALDAAEKISGRLGEASSDAVFVRSAFELILASTPTTQAAPRNSSADPAAQPDSAVPAIGCPPT